MLEVLKLGIKTISDVFGFLVMLLIMIVLDAYIVIKIKRFKIVVNREGILIYNSLSKNKFIRWDDIIKVNFDKKRGIITIKNSDGIKMRISHLLISFKRFCIIAKNLVKFETERSVFIEILYKAGIKWSKN